MGVGVGVGGDARRENGGTIVLTSVRSDFDLDPPQFTNKTIYVVKNDRGCFHDDVVDRVWRERSKKQNRLKKKRNMTGNTRRQENNKLDSEHTHWRE